MAGAARLVIQFGSRRGQSRESAQKSELNEDEVMEGIFLPAGGDLHQITILSKAEWERIQDSLNAPAREAARIGAERKERKDLHLQSQGLMENWTDTIAKALLLTEVLKEREAQIKFQKKKQKMYQSKDERGYQKATLKEEEKAKEDRMKRRQLGRDQLEQIKDHERLAELSRLENIKEGEKIQASTNLYHRELQEEKQKKLEEKLERKQEHQDQVADQVILKAIEKQIEEEEDDKIQAYIDAKKAMTELRTQRNEELFREGEETRENITQHFLAQMNRKVDDEDERIARQVAEIEVEYQKELSEKEEKNKADLKSITEYRIGAMKMKEEKQKQEKEEGKETLRKMIEGDRVYQELDDDKKYRHHCADLEVQESLVMQMHFLAQRNKKVDDEDERIARQVAEIEVEYQKELSEKEEKNKADLKSITEYRIGAMKMKEEKQKQEKEEGKETLRKMIEGDRVYQELDDDKKYRHHCADLEVQEALVMQMGEKIAREKRGKQDEKDHDEKRERNREREGISPGAQNAQSPYTGDTAQGMKCPNENEYEVTKGRLGFTWQSKNS